VTQVRDSRISWLNCSYLDVRQYHVAYDHFPSLVEMHHGNLALSLALTSYFVS